HRLASEPGTVNAVPAIGEAGGDRVEIYADSGIRSGLDALKFLGLGARACFIGRAFVYGLGAYQRAGVTKALEILREELDVTMALTGLTNAADVPCSVLLGAAG